MVLPYSNTDAAIAWKDSRLILSERSDFYIIDNLSIAFHTLPMRMLTLHSVDDLLLLMYMSVISRGLPFHEDGTPSRLKLMNSVLPEFV